jgi:hypothetical protein
MSVIFDVKHILLIHHACIYNMNSKFTRIPKQTKILPWTIPHVLYYGSPNFTICKHLFLSWGTWFCDYCEKQIFCLTSAQKDIAKSAIPSFDSLYAIIKFKKNYVFT